MNRLLKFWNRLLGRTPICSVCKRESDLYPTLCRECDQDYRDNYNEEVALYEKAGIHSNNTVKHIK